MKIPTWVKPAITGGIAGAIVTMIIGFTEGGWYSGSSAEHMAQERSKGAVIAALVPVCVSQQKLDPNSAAMLTELVAMRTSYEQRDFVIKSGWATMPSAAEPDRDVATACADSLAKPVQG